MKPRTESKPASPKKAQKCRYLCCRHEFDSEGPHNRLCRRCKSSDAYRGAGGTVRE